MNKSTNLLAILLLNLIKIAVEMKDGMLTVSKMLSTFNSKVSMMMFFATFY